MTRAECAERIAHLEKLLASGMDSHTADGVTTKFRNAVELRTELSRLYKVQRQLNGESTRHPFATPTF